MKRIVLLVAVLTIVLLTVSCKGANSSEKEDVTTTSKSSGETNTSGQPNNTDQPIVNPPVDLSVDYYYIGDMLFADSMDFNKWFLTNGTYPHSSFKGTIIKVEKIGRVHNPNKDTMMFRYSETLPNVERYESNNKWFYVEYATKYKVWVSKEFMNPENKHYWINNTLLLNTEVCKDGLGNNIYDSDVKVDGTWIRLSYSQNENLEDVYTFEYKDQDKAQYYN